MTSAFFKIELMLECFPEKVEELVSMFSGIDTYDCVVWKDLASNPLVSHNLRNNRAAYRLKKQTVAPFRETPSSIKPPMEIARRGHQGRRGIASDNRIVLSPDEEKREVVDEDDVDVDRENELILALTSGLAVTSPDRSSNGSSNRDRARIRGRPNVVRESVEEGRVFTLLSDFSVLHQHTLEQLFSRTLPPGEELLESDLPSSNILSIVVYQTRTMIDANTSAEPMRITGSDWSVYTISIDGSSWYYATFSCSDLSLVKRTSKSLPSWLKETNTARVRPTTVDAALRCLPPEALVDKEKMRPVISLDGKRATLVFDTLELAIRMEAAFWLERQFLTTKRHWYQHLDLTNMVNRLKDAYRADSTSRV
jgi:hypothetical protein